MYDDYYRGYYPPRYEEPYPRPPGPVEDGRPPPPPPPASYPAYTEPVDPLDPNRPNDVEIVVPNKMQRLEILKVHVKWGICFESTGYMA